MRITRTERIVAWCGIGMLVVSTTALQAEVRLENGHGARPSVVIHETATGPWSPTGPLDARVLNPEGDVNGDGWPATAPSPAGVLAAWREGATGAIALATGTTRWNRTIDIICNAEARFSVAPLTRGWLVAWTDALTRHVFVTGASASLRLGPTLDRRDRPPGPDPPPLQVALSR